HRYSPSFPTRRSSDLVCNHNRFFPLKPARYPVFAPETPTSLPDFRLLDPKGTVPLYDDRRSEYALALPGYEANVAGNQQFHRDQDRKSTRLNSSHVKI